MDCYVLILLSDTKELLFFSKDYFENEWLEKSKGILNPIIKDDLTSTTPFKIYVYGLENEFGGPRIAILPLLKRNDELPIEWLKSTKLPDSEKIQKTVHFITSEQVDFSPEKFLITWGDVDCELAKRFHVASAKVLLCTLIQEFYNNEKILLHGKRRLEMKLSEEDDNFNYINKQNIEKLIEIVSWCYAEDDENTRILLIVDRLSLDINLEKSLLNIVPENINKAFKEAKSRYKYVVLDRKSEYTKELADLQKDISGIVDKYVVSTNDYTLGFLKDVLAFAFILTVGVVAKKFVNEKLLFSNEAGIFFKAFAIYLAISFILRLSHFIVVVYQSEKLAISWKDIVRNHMSSDELKNHVSQALKSVKRSFSIIVFAVSIIYVVMIYMSWNSSETLAYVFTHEKISKETQYFVANR